MIKKFLGWILWGKLYYFFAISILVSSNSREIVFQSLWIFWGFFSLGLFMSVSLLRRLSD